MQTLMERIDEARPKPWNDEELMRELYIEHRMSQNEIRKAMDCSPNTISTWLDKHGIEKYSRSEACKLRFGHPKEVSLHTDTQGYETWHVRKKFVRVHRLVAVAEYGIEAVKGNDIHHRNEVPWDNRPENLEVMDHGEHSTHHKKVDGIDRIRVAELYENGDIATTPLGEMFDITSATVLAIHDEFYGEGAS